MESIYSFRIRWKEPCYWSKRNSFIWARYEYFTTDGGGEVYDVPSITPPPSPSPAQQLSSSSSSMTRKVEGQFAFKIAIDFLDKVEMRNGPHQHIVVHCDGDWVEGKVVQQRYLNVWHLSVVEEYDLQNNIVVQPGSSREDGSGGSGIQQHPGRYKSPPPTADTALTKLAKMVWRQPWVMTGTIQS